MTRDNQILKTDIDWNTEEISLTFEIGQRLTIKKYTEIWVDLGVGRRGHRGSAIQRHVVCLKTDSKFSTCVYTEFSFGDSYGKNTILVINVFIVLFMVTTVMKIYKSQYQVNEVLAP